MGFTTTFHITYPADPGEVSAHDVKRVIEGLSHHCRTNGPKATASIKCGDRPAASNRPLFSFMPTGAPGMFRSASDWDIDSAPMGISEILNLFADLPETTIHRALICFGALNGEVANHLRRDPGAENEIGLYPYDIGLSIGPINIEPDDDEADCVQLGWLSFTISGNGYCFPWTYHNFIDRCLSTDICQDARKEILSIFGAPSRMSLADNVKYCSRRARQLPDGLIAVVEGT